MSQERAAASCRATCSQLHREQQLAEQRALRKPNCYKVQPKPVTLSVSNDLQHWSPSFSTPHMRNKGSVVRDTESIVEAGLWIGLG